MADIDPKDIEWAALREVATASEDGRPQDQAGEFDLDRNEPLREKMEGEA